MKYLHGYLLFLLTICLLSCADHKPSLVTKTDFNGYAYSFMWWKKSIKTGNQVFAIKTNHYAFEFDYPNLAIPNFTINESEQSEDEVFMQNNINQTDILFVLTQIESLKMLQNRLGIKLEDHSNVYIDRDAAFSVASKNRHYPCIVQLDRGQFKNHEFQSPKNLEAFKRLKNQMLLTPKSNA